MSDDWTHFGSNQKRTNNIISRFDISYWQPNWRATWWVCCCTTPLSKVKGIPKQGLALQRKPIIVVRDDCVADDVTNFSEIVVDYSLLSLSLVTDRNLKIFKAAFGQSPFHVLSNYVLTNVLCIIYNLRFIDTIW